MPTAFVYGQIDCAMHRGDRPRDMSEGYLPLSHLASSNPKEEDLSTKCLCVYHIPTRGAFVNFNKHLYSEGKRLISFSA